MNNKTPQDGGPAFPVPPERLNTVNGDLHWAYAAALLRSDKRIATRNMTGCATDTTLRDYFASAALQGMISGVTAQSTITRDVIKISSSLAKTAYDIADSMLAARKEASR